MKKTTALPKRTKILIVGAGPTGLGAAYRLGELGQGDFLVVDADRQVGGLSQSFRDNKGFVWDVGGHVQFSHYSYFDEVMDRALPPEEWLSHLRESWVWIRDRFVPYPFQNNLRYLPADDLWKCLEGIIEADKSANRHPPRNFKEWIHAVFGAGVADVFMDPYNFKVWATPLERMSYKWIGERVAVVDLKKILSNIVFQRDDVSWGPNNKFRFPRTGGTGAIWSSVANLIGTEKISLEKRLRSIDARNRTAHFEGGESVRFETCLSTIPLDVFSGMVEGLPTGIVSRARALHHSSTNVIGIGIEGKMPEALKGKCWMYFPEGNCPFYRVTVFSHYSSSNVPDPTRYYSLMTEVSESEYKPVDQKSLMSEVIQGLYATRLIAPGSEVVSQWHYRAPYGYPVPTVERDEILDEVLPTLEQLGLYSRGRFGAWKYEVSNQDHSFMQGVEWSNHLVKGEEERTLGRALISSPRKAA